MNLWGPGPWDAEPEAKAWTTDDRVEELEKEQEEWCKFAHKHTGSGCL